MLIEILLILCAFIISYSYLLYGVLILVLNIFKKNNNRDYNRHLPTLTIIVAAYNEEEIIREKVLNTLKLKYDKIQSSTVRTS